MKRFPKVRHKQKNTQKINKDISTFTEISVNQKSVNVCKHAVKINKKTTIGQTCAEKTRPKNI